MIYGAPAMIFATVTAAMLAQADPMSGWGTSLVQLGPIGAVLFWFMWRLERRLAEQQRAVNKLADSILLLVSAPTVRCPIAAASPLNDQVRRLLEERAKEET